MSCQSSEVESNPAVRVFERLVVAVEHEDSGSVQALRNRLLALGWVVAPRPLVDGVVAGSSGPDRDPARSRWAVSDLRWGF